MPLRLSNSIAPSSSLLILSLSCLNLLLNPSSEFFISVTIIFSSRISVWFFFIFSISLLIVSFYSCITFLISFHSFFCFVLFSFRPLSIFKTVILKALFSNTWTSSVIISVNLFCSFESTTLSCYFVCFVIFCW